MMVPWSPEFLWCLLVHQSVLTTGIIASKTAKTSPCDVASASCLQWFAIPCFLLATDISYHPNHNWSTAQNNDLYLVPRSLALNHDFCQWYPVTCSCFCPPCIGPKRLSTNRPENFSVLLLTVAILFLPSIHINSPSITNYHQPQFSIQYISSAHDVHLQRCCHFDYDYDVPIHFCRSPNFCGAHSWVPTPSQWSECAQMETWETFSAEAAPPLQPPKLPKNLVTLGPVSVCS